MHSNRDEITYSRMNKCSIWDRRLRLISAFPAFLGAALLLPINGIAGQQFATFSVTATVAASCSVTANSINFGGYDPLNTWEALNSSDITVNCTNGTAYSIALDKGANGTIAQRLLSDGTHTLNYNLYIGFFPNSPGCSGGTIFGDGITGGSTVPGTGGGPGNSQSTKVYACIPAGQNAPYSSSNYTDKVNVTITF